VSSIRDNSASFGEAPQAISPFLPKAGIRSRYHALVNKCIERDSARCVELATRLTGRSESVCPDLLTPVDCRPVGRNTPAADSFEAAVKKGVALFMVNSKRGDGSRLMVPMELRTEQVARRSPFASDAASRQTLYYPPNNGCASHTQSVPLVPSKYPLTTSLTDTRCCTRFSTRPRLTTSIAVITRRCAIESEAPCS
jgi:hypothetical protein